MKLRISTATGSGQLLASNDPVLVFEAHARSTNAFSAYLGLDDVSDQNGRELPPGESCTLNFALPDTGRSSGSMLLSKFYVQLSGNDKLDWTAIIRGDAE